jgi:hypothetical protein
METLFLARPCLERIEREWKNGKLTKEAAKAEVIKAFQRASTVSTRLRDNFVAQLYETQIRWLEEMFPRFAQDLYLQWLMGPYLFHSIFDCN